MLSPTRTMAANHTHGMNRKRGMLAYQYMTAEDLEQPIAGTISRDPNVESARTDADRARA